MSLAIFAEIQAIKKQLADALARISALEAQQASKTLTLKKTA